MADDEPGEDPDADERRDAPLADLAERVRGRRGERSDAPDEGGDWGLEEFFESEPFEDLEEESLWDAIDVDAGPAAGPDVRPGEAPDEHVVPKRSYCEACEHFSRPPEVHCNHPGTTILEFEDNDHLRVRNCPIVAERLELGEFTERGMTPGTFGSQ